MLFRYPFPRPDSIQYRPTRSTVASRYRRRRRVRLEYIGLGVLDPIMCVWTRVCVRWTRVRARAYVCLCVWWPERKSTCRDEGVGPMTGALFFTARPTTRRARCGASSLARSLSFWGGGWPQLLLGAVKVAPAFFGPFIPAGGAAAGPPALPDRLSVRRPKRARVAISKLI